MSVIAFSFDEKLNDHPRLPDILLDGFVMDINNPQQKEAIDLALRDRNSFLVSSSKEYDATHFAAAYGTDIDQIRAKKVDLHDMQRAFQIARGSKKNPTDYFYDRDIASAQNRMAFVKNMNKALGNYEPTKDQRLDERRAEIVLLAKQELKHSGELLNNKATRAIEVMDSIPKCHAAKVHHGFTRMQYITPHDSFMQHVSMINLNNEAGFGKRLFEVDYKQAQDVLHTLYTKVDDRVTNIASKYLGMENGAIVPERKTEFTELALNQFPDLLNFGIQTDPETAFRQLSNADRMSELFKTKMPDGTNLINPAWFEGLRQAGVQYNIQEVHKNKSVAARYLLNNPKPMGMQQKESARYDFVVDMLKVRQDYITFQKNNLDIDKVLNIADENENKVPMSAMYAGAISKRFTSSGKHNLNTLGMQTATKSILKAPDDGVVIDIDYSQAEVVMAAAMLNNKPILQAYNERADIYLALGLQAEHVVGGNPLPWEQLIAETKHLQETTPPEVKSDKNSDYYRMRSGGKMVVIPAIYGSGAETLARDQGITVPQANTLMQAFDHVFPEISRTRDDIGEYLRQNVGKPDAPVFQFGGEDGKLVTINANDKAFTSSYGYPDPCEEVLAGGLPQHVWLMDTLGLRNQGQDNQHLNETALTVTLSNGEKMVYNSPHISQGERGSGVHYVNDDGNIAALPDHTILQNAVQFATFAAVREMTVATTNKLDELGIDSKYMLNIHDSNAYVAKNELEAEKTLEVMKSGVMSRSSLIPNLEMAFTVSKGPRLAEVSDIIDYQPMVVNLEFDDQVNTTERQKDYDPTAADKVLNLGADKDFDFLLGDFADVGNDIQSEYAAKNNVASQGYSPQAEFG